MIRRFVDVRAGEMRTLAGSFLLLFLVLVAHTILDTARDALLLSDLSARALGVVYVALAALAVPASALAGTVSARFGPKRSLTGALAIGAAALVLLYLTPANRASAIAIYLATGVTGAVFVPLFWMLIGRLLTLGQAKRLLAPINVAAMVGGLVGSTAAAALVARFEVRGLLLVAAAVMLVAGAHVGFGPAGTTAPIVARVARTSLGSASRDKFVRGLALLVVLMTLTALVVDYFFMWTVARTVPKEELGAFFGWYYAAVNAASLVLQLAVTGALVRRVGVTAALAIAPGALSLGALWTLVTGGGVRAVLGLKALDVGFRYSTHRNAMELVYLPMHPHQRERAKPLIDGALVKVAQAAAALALGALGALEILSPGLFAVLVTLLAVVSLGAALSVRGPYVDLLRRSLERKSGASAARRQFDLAQAEFLVATMASDEPADVLAAMRALERRGRQGLIPALILHHRDREVLLTALAIFGEAERTDWLSLGRALLRSEDREVRFAAARAMAKHGAPGALELLSTDRDEMIAGYARARLMLREREEVDLDRVAPGEGATATRTGMLRALAESAPDPRGRALLVQLMNRLASERSQEVTRLLVSATAAQRAESLIPFLVERLRFREGREATMTALVELGAPALDAIERVLTDPTAPRNLRSHLPGAVAHFGAQRAADLLVDRLEAEPDGLIRYRALRALGRIAGRYDVRVSRTRMTKLAEANMVEALRMAAMHGLLTADWDEEGATPAERLLSGLLQDKQEQAIERTFRLLKLARPREDMRLVFLSVRSQMPRARANAVELLDALLSSRREARLRTLLRLLMDDLSPGDLVARARAVLDVTLPADQESLLALLRGDHDRMIAALASHLLEGAGTPFRFAAEGGRASAPPSAGAVSARAATPPPTGAEVLPLVDVDPDESVFLEREVMLGAFADPSAPAPPSWIIDRLAALVVDQPVRRGDVLFAEGQSSERVYFMRAGRVRLESATASPVVVSGMGALGWADALSNRLHTRTATALEDTAMMSVRSDDLLEMLDESFELTRQAILAWARASMRLFDAVLAAGVTVPTLDAGKDVPRRTAPLTPVEQMLLLRNVDLLGRARVQTLADLIAHATEVSLAEGETLFGGAQGRERVYVVVSGRVVVERAEPRATVTFGPGLLVGGVTSLGALSDEWSARVTEPTTVLSFSLERWFDEMEEHRDLAQAALASIADEQDALVQLLGATGEDVQLSAA